MDKNTLHEMKDKKRKHEHQTLTRSTLEHILRIKSELLIHGFLLSSSFFKDLENLKIEFNFGRKGGAGPAGGRYFRFENGSIVNSPLWHEKSEKPRLVLQHINEKNEITFYDKKEQWQPLPMILIPIPSFYKKVNSEGIPLNKIALMHGDVTLATTINQKCRYWRGNTQCKFCAIELSLNSGATIEKKTGMQLIEAIKEARKENPQFAQHLTLTTGTTETKDKGMRDYYEVVKEIKERFPEVKIHIQIEPFEDSLQWYERLKEAGVDSIGIHLEIMDDTLRKQFCPGKGHIPREDYYKHWEKAVEVFGENNVDSFVLIGLEPLNEKFYEELERMTEYKVIPHITPARNIPGVPLKVDDLDSEEFYNLSLYTAELCKKHGIDPSKNQAGCVRCRGCSTIVDAWDIITHS